MRALVFLVLQIKLIEAATVNNVRLLVPAAAAASREEARGRCDALLFQKFLHLGVRVKRNIGFSLKRNAPHVTALFARFYYH